MQVEPYQIIQGIIILFSIGASWQNLKSDTKSLKKEVGRINGNIVKLFEKTDKHETAIGKLEERTKEM